MESQTLSDQQGKTRVQSLLAAYGSSSSSSPSTSSDDDDDLKGGRIFPSTSPSNNEEDYDGDDGDDDTKNHGAGELKTKGELSLEELPPIQELNISMSSNALRNLGSIMNIVDKLVVIQSIRGTPALNLDSVLFLLDGSPVGEIFDVFGPVNEPLYSIRFNCEQDIIEKKLKAGVPVYYVPAHPSRVCPTVNGHHVTDYVFVNQLKQAKGSDASWTHNNEPPDDVRDYSDDEEERRARSARAARRHNQQRPSSLDDGNVSGNGNHAGHARDAKRAR